VTAQQIQKPPKTCRRKSYRSPRNPVSLDSRGRIPSLLKFPANRQTIRSRPRRSRRSLSHQRSPISQSRTPAFRQAAELAQNALGLT
jgi:hypothetical protein